MPSKRARVVQNHWLDVADHWHLIAGFLHPADLLAWRQVNRAGRDLTTPWLLERLRERWASLSVTPPPSCPLFQWGSVSGAALWWVWCGGGVQRWTPDTLDWFFPNDPKVLKPALQWALAHGWALDVTHHLPGCMAPMIGTVLFELVSMSETKLDTERPDTEWPFLTVAGHHYLDLSNQYFSVEDWQDLRMQTSFRCVHWNPQVNARSVPRWRFFVVVDYPHLPFDLKSLGARYTGREWSVVNAQHLIHRYSDVYYQPWTYTKLLEQRKAKYYGRGMRFVLPWSLAA